MLRSYLYGSLYFPLISDFWTFISAASYDEFLEKNSHILQRAVSCQNILFLSQLFLSQMAAWVASGIITLLLITESSIPFQLHSELSSSLSETRTIYWAHKHWYLLLQISSFFHNNIFLLSVNKSVWKSLRPGSKNMIFFRITSA